jgi:predicted metal-dependent phosphoesterase TrpH
MIRRARGLAVLAHPAARAGWAAATSFIPALVEVGLVGLECYYSGYPDDLVRELLALARQHGLVATGGSDFHGPLITPDSPLGGTWVPLSVVAELKALRAASR